MTIRAQESELERYREALFTIARAESGGWGTIAHHALNPAGSTPAYRLWVNDDRTVLVRLWDTGALEVATRPDRDAVWGPPVWLTEEKT